MGEGTLGAGPCVKACMDAEERKGGNADWKTDALPQSPEVEGKRCVRLFLFILPVYFFPAASSTRAPPTPAHRLQIYRRTACVGHHLFRECFVPPLPTLEGGEDELYLRRERWER